MVKANIYDGKIFVENSTVSDSVKFDTVKFTFPDSWNGYAKTAVFKSEDGQIINLVLDGANPLCINENECYIPHEVIKSPCFYLSVFGVSGDSVATTTQVSVPVLQSGYAEGNEPNEPTPTEYQQLIDLASYTKVIAQSVRDDADKGLFKGEKGDKGDTGKQGVQGEKGDKGEQGIQGPQGIQGKKGERGEQGIQGEKGDKGEQGIQGPQGIQGEKGERGEQGIQGEKGDKGDVNTEYLHNNFANALKVSKSGSAIVIDDTSPVEHELGVTIERKNLFNMHYVTNRTTTQHCNGNGGWYEDVVAYRGKTITYQVQVDFTNTLESAAGFRVKVWWYDANKKNLSVDTANAISNNGGLAISTLTTTVPNNATYAVFGVEASFSMWTDISAREGSSISYTNGMVELGSTATAYTPYISDFSTVNVSRYGKNLWNNGTVKLIESMSNDNGVFTQTNVDTKSYLHFVMQTYDGKTYDQFGLWYIYDPQVVSGTFTKQPNANTLRVGHNGSIKNVMSWFDISHLIDGQTYTIQVNITNATQGTFSWQDIQIELGSTATDYEPYKEPQTVKANVDGTVDGLTSLSPNMTLVTNQSGAIINLEYNADTKKYIDNKFAELQALILEV